MNPIISVIIAVHNSERFLKECLDSVINQSLRDIEVIIVNDGSVDKSPEIIEEIKGSDDRVKVINQDNQGAATARNNGIKAACGRYLSILDSDDLFDSDMLEKMYIHAESNRSEVVVCPFRYFGDNKNVRRGLTLPNELLKGGVFSVKSYPEHIFQIAAPNAWCKLFNREFINKNNIFFQDLETCNDIYFSYVAIAFACRVSVLNTSFVSYRVNNEKSLTSIRGIYPYNIIYASEKIKRALVEKNIYKEVKNSFTRRILSCFSYELQFVNDDDFEEFNSKMINFLIDIDS